MISDLKYALRQLTQNPGHTVIIVLVLALGIGSCSITYSIMDRIMLRPTLCPEPDRMVRLHCTQQPGSSRNSLIKGSYRCSVADYLDLIAQSKSFESIGACGGAAINLTGTGEPISTGALSPTLNYFDIMGIKTVLGRGFLPEEYVEGKNNVIILTHSFWQNNFGGDPGIIGRTLTINDKPTTVIGVTAKDVQILTGTSAFTPLVFTEVQQKRRDWRFLAPVNARLKPGVTVAQAQTEMKLIMERLAQQYPDTNKGWYMDVLLLADAYSTSFRQQIWTLLASVGCVLLVACANVANLLLIRGLSHQREYALRTAFGASRSRLIRQMMIESGLLATFGCIGGIFIAAMGIKYLPSLLTNNAEMRWFQFIELNSHVLAISVGCGFLTTLLFGFLPALINSRVNLNDALKQGGRSSETKTAGLWRSFLIVLEVAMAFVLLTSASLLLQSFNRLSQLDPGFNPEKLSFMQIVLMGDRYKTPEQRSVFINNLHTRLTTLPGVESVGVTSVRPFVAAGAWGAFAVESRVPVLHSEWPEFTLYPVSPDYLKTMGIRLLRGRTITHGDTPSKTPAILINESTARKYFPDEEPIGRYLILDGPTFVGAPGSETKCEIVGVVGDVVQESFDAKTRPQIYTSISQCTPGWLCFVMRTSNDPASLLLAARQQVYAIDKDLSIREQKLFTQSLDERLSQRRFQVFLLSAFAAVTLLIAAIGIYGVIAFSVSRRTYEIGIRLAMGAQTKTILHMILNQGMRLIAYGLGLGLAASPLLYRLLQPHLFQTRAYDPVNMLTVAVVLSLAALVACWRPARRATHVDPIIALRAE